jgi:ketosteroid isomerase-like protein
MTTADQNSADVLTVSRLISRYFRCLDTHDAPGTKDCLTEDLEAFHTLTGPIQGREAFLALTMMELPRLKMSQHYCTNREITVDGDRAKCLSYVFAQHLVIVGNEEVLMPGGARYSQEFVRTADGWRIARLRCDVTWLDPRLADVYKP